MPITVSPIKCHNFKWAKLKLWSLYETACILSGVEPNPKPKNIHEETSAILDLMGHAIEAEVLWPAQNPQEESSFYPSEVVAWAKTIGIGVTTEFEMLIEIYSARRPAEYHHENSQKLTVLAIKNSALRSKIALQRKLKLIAAPHRTPFEIPGDTVVLETKIRQRPISAAVKAVAENHTLDAESTTGNNKETPWFIHNPNDPAPDQHWYTPARYHARELIKRDSTLNGKRNILSDRVAAILSDFKIFKRGGKKPLGASTILKAFSNVDLKA